MTADDTRLARATAVALGAGRLAIGAGIWFAPRPSARALGLGELDGRALALGRIAATRDLALGVWQLRSLDDPDELRRSTTAVAACDAGDALAFGLALGNRETRRIGMLGLAGALPATVAGVWLTSRLRG